MSGKFLQSFLHNPYIAKNDLQTKKAVLVLRLLDMLYTPRLVTEPSLASSKYSAAAVDKWVGRAREVGNYQTESGTKDSHISGSGQSCNL
ncbi:hypothetical protein J6590_076797 [Homalodisca vitripennis]|nr:hypothetical protein J6590_076797 [Homalodisca vitripennis]